jgi:penicillin amidase
MPRWLKIFLSLLVSFLIVGTVGAVIFYKVLSSTLPKYEGEISTKGISGEIEIYRDSLAIPYVYAKNDEDAAFALGYLHAQERLFSMDLMRRAGEGRMSEVFGEETLPFDKMFRTVGIRNFAYSNYAKLNPQVKKVLEAYSRGVNHFIEEGNLPAEFGVLGYEPYKWKPEHSLIVIRMMGWQLNMSWWSDVCFARLVQRLGAEKVKEILPDYPENGPVIIPPELKNAPAINQDLAQTDKNFRSFMGFLGSHLGSNSWVVNGSLSASGKPIIANDPHLSYSAPDIWYAAVIRAPNWNAEGVTLPGVPGIVIGKNRNISWALTNIMVDDADFYIEKLDAPGKNYMVNGEWRKLEIRKEHIKVKGKPDVIIDVKSTHRGPLISDIHPASVVYPDKKNRPVMSMKWAGNTFSDELFGYLEINKASGWNDFKNAVSYFSVPGQNFIYADKDGNIGYVFGTHLPVRGSNSPTMVYDGTNEANDWTGYVPQSEIPVLFNPPAGFIASANNKTLQGFPYHIGNLWEPPSRYQRIVELLSSKQKHSVNDYQRYQQDIVSPYARDLTKYIVDAFKDKKITNRKLRLVIELFQKWDYDFDEFSQVPAVYAEFLKYLLQNTYRDEMGKDMYNEFLFMANVPYRSIMQLLEKGNSEFSKNVADSISVPGVEGDSVKVVTRTEVQREKTWFDNIKTPQVETRDDIIRESLVDAINELSKLFGDNVADWQWGKLHQVTFEHAFSGISGLVDDFVNIGPFPIGGDGTTIFNTEYPFFEGIKEFPRFNHKPFQNTVGPSMRYIFDFAHPDEFYLVLNTGQSGNVMSDHYKDMTKKWLYGKYVRIKTDDASVRNAGNKLLRIIPE